MLMFPNGSGIAMSKSPQSNGATQQILGRERRERVSQLAWCGGGCFDSRRRVNSTVRRLSVTGEKRHASLLLQLHTPSAIPDGGDDSSRAQDTWERTARHTSNSTLR